MQIAAAPPGMESNGYLSQLSYGGSSTQSLTTSQPASRLGGPIPRGLDVAGRPLNQPTLTRTSTHVAVPDQSPHLFPRPPVFSRHGSILEIPHFNNSYSAPRPFSPALRHPVSSPYHFGTSPSFSDPRAYSATPPPPPYAIFNPTAYHAYSENAYVPSGHSLTSLPRAPAVPLRDQGVRAPSPSSQPELLGQTSNAPSNPFNHVRLEPGPSTSVELEDRPLDSPAPMTPVFPPLSFDDLIPKRPQLFPKRRESTGIFAVSPKDNLIDRSKGDSIKDHAQAQTPKRSLGDNSSRKDWKSDGQKGSSEDLIPTENKISTAPKVHGDPAAPRALSVDTKSRKRRARAPSASPPPVLKESSSMDHDIRPDPKPPTTLLAPNNKKNPRKRPSPSKQKPLVSSKASKPNLKIGNHRKSSPVISKIDKKVTESKSQSEKTSGVCQSLSGPATQARKGASGTRSPEGSIGSDGQKILSAVHQSSKDLLDDDNAPSERPQTLKYNAKQPPNGHQERPKQRIMPARRAHKKKEEIKMDSKMSPKPGRLTKQKGPNMIPNDSVEKGAGGTKKCPDPSQVCHVPALSKAETHKEPVCENPGASTLGTPTMTIQAGQSSAAELLAVLGRAMGTLGSLPTQPASATEQMSTAGHGLDDFVIDDDTVDQLQTQILIDMVVDNDELYTFATRFLEGPGRTSEIQPGEK